MIAVFDSGIGGISVLAEIKSVLPDTDIYFFADSKNAPYGSKDKTEIIDLMQGHCDNFIKMGCEALVIACNTATSAAAEYLRNNYSIPIIGIEPAIKPALQNSSGKILVLATELTIREEKLHKLVESLHSDDRIIYCACPGLMEMIEENTDEEIIIEYFEEHIKNRENISAIVLGCTHYSFIKNIINNIFPAIPIYEGNLGVARHLKDIMEEQNISYIGEGELVMDNSLTGIEKENYRQKCLHFYKNYTQCFM